MSAQASLPLKRPRNSILDYKITIPQIYDGTTLSHYIDGSNENTASWMRFIRCARHKDEQNLYAFQYNGNIYYRAFKDIPLGTEMLVWYDENYPMYMGIPLGIHVDETSNTPTAQCKKFIIPSESLSRSQQIRQLINQSINLDELVNCSTKY